MPIHFPIRRGRAPGRRSRTATACAVLVVLAVPSAAHAGFVCAGESCEGSYLAVTTTGTASSSTGVAVSAAGDSNGRYEVEGTNKSAAATDPTTGQMIGLDNTGDVGPNPLTANQAVDATYNPPPEVISAKEQAFAKLLPEVEYQLAALRAGIDPTLADRACPDGRCPARTKVLSQPYSHQVTSYYCGPASTAAVLWQMTGTGWDQHALASADWLNTSREGTYYESITKVLNRVATDRRINVQYMSSKLAEGQPGSYMTKLVSAVDYYDGYNPHSIVNNVKTSFFDYWGDKRYPAMHFNVSNGYELNGGGYVYVTEIYNPAQVGSKRQTNPYGQWWVPLDQMYSAVMGNKRIVIW